MDPLVSLSERSGVTIRRNESLAQHCTYEVGGPAEYFVEPESSEELSLLLEFCREEDLTVTIIGKGSNLLISDKGIPGMVICIADQMSSCGFLSACPGVEDYTAALADLVDEPVVDSEGYAWFFAEAGASMIETAKYSARQGLSGLEFASGIPGTVGGALYMNAGAYGGTTEDVAAITYYLNQDGEVAAARWTEQKFGYRQSVFQDVGGIVLATCYRLKPGDPAEIDATIRDLTQRREKSQPLELPSCGSVFKRPEGYYAGKLIMDSGLQGHRIGGAEVSRKHAGFIVNQGGATASDIANLIAYIRRTVFDQFGVTLETEVRFIGDWS